MLSEASQARPLNRPGEGGVEALSNQLPYGPRQAGYGKHSLVREVINLLILAKLIVDKQMRAALICELAVEGS